GANALCAPPDPVPRTTHERGRSREIVGCAQRKTRRRMEGRMIATGAQIRAGRALLDWTRSRLAEAAGLHKNSVAYWERCPEIPTDRFLVPLAVQKIEEALRREGVRLFVSREFRLGVGAVSKDQFSSQYARTRARERSPPGLTREKHAPPFAEITAREQRTEAK